MALSAWLWACAVNLNSTGFQIGHSNSQSISVSIKQILRGIEEVDAPADAKVEAKGKLREFSDHSIVNTVIGVTASAILGTLGRSVVAGRSRAL